MHRFKKTFILFWFILFFLKGLSFSDTLKITTWNIQMTPRVFAPFTKHARKKQKVRIPKIIQYLNSTNFDILVLQEVFDKAISKKLQNDLKIKYPYSLIPKKEGFSLKLSSGVMILSKYPIQLKEHVIFNVSQKIDKVAQKGCSLVEININEKIIYVAGTHLDSKSPESRNLQYQITSEKIIKPYSNDTIPLFLVGDFNTNFNSPDYDNMMTYLKLKNHELNDDRPYTFDEFNSWNKKGHKSWIDFVFYHENKKIEILDQYILRPVMKFKKMKMDLADHYQLVLKLVIH